MHEGFKPSIWKVNSQMAYSIASFMLGSFTNQPPELAHYLPRLTLEVTSGVSQESHSAGEWLKNEQ